MKRMIGASLLAGAMVLGTPAVALAAAPGNSATTPGVDQGTKKGWTSPTNPHFTDPGCGSCGGGGGGGGGGGASSRCELSVGIQCLPASALATKIDNPSNGNPPPGLTKDKPDNPHFNPGGPGPTP